MSRYKYAPLHSMESVYVCSRQKETRIYLELFRFSGITMIGYGHKLNEPAREVIEINTFWDTIG